jgi:D-alanyl-D-alanine carboxypeptidase
LDDSFERTTNICRFVKEMNLYAAKLGMRDSQFSNPHGLSFKGNKSTAEDVSRLSSYFLSEDIFRKVVRTQLHTCQSTKATYTWNNTNILLKRPFCYGLKTGFTPNAGACLVVLYDLLQIEKEKSTATLSQRNPLEGHIILTLLCAKD